MTQSTKVTFFLSLLMLFAGAAKAQPQRIVSLNLCVDQILIDLVPKDRIAALSFLAADKSMSAIADRTAQYHRVRGDAEDVLAYDPDLVFAGAYSTPATRRMLEQLGKRVVVVRQPTSISGVRDVIRQLAAQVGEPARGDVLINAFDSQIAEARAKAGLAPLPPGQKQNDVDLGQSPTALAIEVNNIVSQHGTLLNDAMRVAGLRNSSGDLATGLQGRVDLETLVLNPPDVMVFANAPTDFRTVLADNLRHPVLQKIEADRPSVSLPMWTTLCGTQYVAEAVSRLADVHHKLAKRKTGP